MHERKRHRLDDLDTFVQVAEHGSLSGAAQALGLPPSTVGRRVSRLEDALGMALLHREHRRVGLTADGEALFRRCRSALRELEDAAATVERPGEGVGGILRLTAGVGALGRPGFGEMLAAYRARWPGVQLDVRVTNRVVDLVEEGVDVALRPYTPMTPLRGGELRVRRLGGAPFGLYGPPELAELSPDALDGRLIGHPILGMARAVGEHFPGWSALVGLREVARADDFDSCVALAAAGIGVAIAPRIVAARHLDAGTLAPLCAGLDLGGSEICLMWPAARHLAPRVRAFVDHCVDWAPRLGLDPVGRWRLGAV